MPNYVYSTATCSGAYVEYHPMSDGASHAVVRKKVVINGGHGVAQQNGTMMGAIYTPRGVVTQVSDEDLEFLERNPAFRRHVDRGFLVVDSKKVDPEKKAANMAQADGSAPITPKDFEKSEHSTPNTPIYKAKPADQIAHETVATPVKAKARK